MSNSHDEEAALPLVQDRDGSHAIQGVAVFESQPSRSGHESLVELGRQAKMRQVDAWLSLSVPGTLCLIFRTLHFASVIPPFRREFFERDPTLSYPDRSNEVPTYALFLLSCCFPLVVLVSLYTSPSLERSPSCKYLPPSEKWVAVAWHCTALLWTVLITDCFKVFVGRLRPHFFAACNYKGYGDALRSGDPEKLSQYLNATVPGRLGDISDCLADAHVRIAVLLDGLLWCDLTI